MQGGVEPQRGGGLFLPEALVTVPDKRIPISRSIPGGNRPISRRALFPSAIGAVAVLGLGVTLGGSEIAKAQSKVDKKTAKYQDHPNKDQHCAICSFFRAPKSCQLVEGDISPNGWCSFFAKKA